MGCLLGLFSLPIAFMNWVRENGVKGYIVAAILLIGSLISLVIIVSSVNNALFPASELTAEQQAELTPPPRKDAPYQVTTDTRIYYALIAVKNEAGTVTMTNYYEWLNSEWTLTTGILVLDENYGTVTIAKRRLGE